MAFFLIGRGPDDDLRLLSTKPLESRQAALAELSRLSAEPTFEHWDAEVSVVDLDSGVPVLLVRPAAAVLVPEPREAETGDADAWQADLPATDVAVVEPAAVAAAPAEQATAEVAQPAAVAADSVPGDIEAPFWEPPTVALIEPVSDAAIADAIVAEVDEAPSPETMPAFELELAAIEAESGPIELEPALSAEPEFASAAQSPATDSAAVPAVGPSVEPTPSVEENDELRAAILRTTQHMTAEGITPPESIGPAAGLAEASELAQPAAEATEMPAEQAPPVETTEAEPSATDAESTSEPIVLEMAAPAVAEVVAPKVVEPLRADAEAQQAPVGGSGPSFWPWNKSANDAAADTAVAPEVAGVYEALEEPAVELPEPDVEAVLQGAGSLEPEPGPDIAVELLTAPPQEPMSNVTAEVAAVAQIEVPAEESDFILDLESVESASSQVQAEGTSAAPVAADSVAVETPGTDASFAESGQPVPLLGAQHFGAEPGNAPDAVSPLEDYTCDDCVHTETCPNRDQRLPKDCGSFQWR